MLEKFSIRAQILGLFTVLSFVILLITASLALNNIASIGDKTETIATEAMVEQIHRNMLLSSDESANVIERKAFTAFSTVQALADAASQILSDDIFEETSTYSDLEVNSISDAYSDVEYGFLISKNTSTYYTPDSTTLTLAINSTIKKSANLDTIFSSLFQDNPEFLWFNLVITKGKILRRFPGSLVSVDRNYDPTVEAWYAQSILQGEPIFTPPNYEVNIGKWKITIAIPLYDGNGDNIGVMSGDLTLNAIQDKVGE
ncbi:MAG: PDC sensor domain-containing protein, partial [Candidatus Kariarchaeaceae archaeon]